MSTSIWKVPLVTGALVAAILAALQLVITIVSFLYTLTFGQAFSGLLDPHNLPNFVGAILAALLRFAVFGFGVFVSLRWVAPIAAPNSAAPNDWRRTIVRSVIAAAFGAVALVVLGLLLSVVASASPGSYPFGYSFQPEFDTNRLGVGVLGDVVGAVTAALNWLPVVVLGGVFQKLWLAKHPESAATPDRASVSAKP